MSSGSAPRRKSSQHNGAAGVDFDERPHTVMAVGHGRLDADRRYSPGREYNENEYGGLPVHD